MEPSLYVNKKELYKEKNSVEAQITELTTKQLRLAACIFYQEISATDSTIIHIGFDEFGDFYVRMPKNEYGDSYEYLQNHDYRDCEHHLDLSNTAHSIFPSSFLDNQRERNLSFHNTPEGLDQMLVFLIGDIEAKVLKATSLQQKMETDLPQQDATPKKMKV